MKNLQELRIWVIAEVENAQERANHYQAIGDYKTWIGWSNRRSAFSEMLRELNLLLKIDTGAST